MLSLKSGNISCIKPIFTPASNGFFLESCVRLGYTFKSASAFFASFAADLNSFSWPTVGGLNLPNTTTKFLLPVSSVSSVDFDLTFCGSTVLTFCCCATCFGADFVFCITVSLGFFLSAVFSSGFLPPFP